MKEIFAHHLVIGGGPAGIAAAVAAATPGFETVLVDAGSHPGGQIWRRGPGGPESGEARAWRGLLATSAATVLNGAEVIDVDGQRFVLSTADGLVRCTAMHVVLATGARELFLPFPGWTLPNVFGAGGVQALLKAGLNVRRRRVVLAGTGPLLLPVASTLSRAGARLVVVAEQTPAASLRTFARSLWRTPGRLAAAGVLRAGFLGTPYAANTWVVRADGDDRVREVTLTDGVRTWRVACDILAVGYGLVPNTELARLLGADASPAGIVVNERQTTTLPWVFAAGECTGIGGAPLALAEGRIAGFAATRGGSKIPKAWLARRAVERDFAARVADAFPLRDEVTRLADAGTIICRCEDVRAGALGGVHDLREARLHTRVGMGACQGRVCGAALAVTRGWGSNASRPPLLPMPVSALAADAP